MDDDIRNNGRIISRLRKRKTGKHPKKLIPHRNPKRNQYSSHNNTAYRNTGKHISATRGDAKGRRVGTDKFVYCINKQVMAQQNTTTATPMKFRQAL